MLRKLLSAAALCAAALIVTSASAAGGAGTPDPNSSGPKSQSQPQPQPQPPKAASQPQNWAPFSARCAGKSECGPTDVVELKAESASSPALSKAFFQFDKEGKDVTIISVSDGSPPKTAQQILASFPLAPNLTEWIQSSTDPKQREILLNAPNARAVGYVRMEAAGAAYLVPLNLDVTSLWVNGALGLRIEKVACDEPCKFSSTLTLKVPHWPAWAAATKGAPAKLNLYLDGVKIPEVTATPVPANGQEKAKLLFTLRRLADKPESVAAWNTVMTKAFREYEENARFIVGIGDERGILATAEKDQAVLFDVPSPWIRRSGIFGLAIALLVIVFILNRRGTFSWIRDDYPVPDDLKALVKNRSFSLGRTQMLWWTCVIVAGMVGVFLSTGEAFSLNETCLVLIGISVATAAGAVAAIPTGVVALTEALDKAQAELAALPAGDPGLPAARQKVADIRNAFADAVKSKSFVRDLSSSFGDGSAGLHRLQNIVFTVALGGWFLWVLYTCGSMPTLSTTMLALMGISGSAYVGFKMAGP